MRDTRDIYKTIEEARKEVESMEEKRDKNPDPEVLELYEIVEMVVKFPGD